MAIASFHRGWANLKSICTLSPKLDAVIPEVVTYKQQSTCMSTSCGISWHLIVFLSVYFYISYWWQVFLYMYTCISHLSYAQNMEAWCLNWWLVERFEVVSKSWSQNLLPHSSKLKRKILKAVFSFPLHLANSDYLVY